MMTMRRALWVILAVSVVGIAFSGTLSYRELCLAEAGGCTAAPAGGLFGVPVCVYGLLMYLFVGLVARLALWFDTAQVRPVSPPPGTSYRR